MKAYEEYIGDNGIGQFIQDGGTNTKAFQIYIGYFSGSSGIYTLNGGEIAADAQYVGYWGSGEFNQSGGINTISHWDLEIGYGSGSIGAYNLSANGYLSVNRDESVGYYGTGEFNQTGGTNTIAGHLYLGYASGSSGTYNFSGGSLEAGGLDINYGWMDIDVSEIDLFAVSGDNVSLLDGYIAEDKIIDSTLSPGQYLYAFYDSEDDWTTLDVGFIPEPSTFLLLAPALLGFAGVVLKRRK